MSKEKTLRKITRILMALALVITTVFTSVGTFGITEVKAADEPEGRGTDWDYLYSELYFGEGKAFPVGTKIYMDLDSASLGFGALEKAVCNDYFTIDGQYDSDLSSKSYWVSSVKKGDIFTLPATYKDDDITIKTDGYWYCFNDSFYKKSFYGTIASSEKDGCKDLKVPEDEIQSSIAPADLKAGSKITELNVTVDLSKVPELTVGAEIGDWAEDMPEVPADTVAVSSSKVDTDIGYYWAVKATEDHVKDGYLVQEYYEEYATYDYLVPLYYFDESYKISENDTYYCYVFIEANKGYVFADENGVDVSDVVKSNLSGVFAYASGAMDGIVQGTDIAIFLKLGTPSEIKYNRDHDPDSGSSSGGSSSGTSGKVNADATFAEDSPVKGASLANSKDELLAASGIFTEAEKKEIANGTDAKVWLELDKVDLSTVPEADQAAILEKAKAYMGEGTALTYFDASLFKQIAGQTTQISEPGISMKLTIKIPTELLTNDQNVTREYTIIRLHNGQAEEIKGVFDAVSGEFSFETDKFSTYAIAYKDTVKNNGGNGNGDGNGNAGGNESGNNNAGGNIADTSVTGTDTNVATDTSADNAQTAVTSPKTGESNAMMVWAMAAMISLAGAGVILYRIKRA